MRAGLQQRTHYALRKQEAVFLPRRKSRVSGPRKAMKCADCCTGKQFRPNLPAFFLGAWIKVNEHAPRKSRRPAAARDRQNVRQRAECTGVHTSGTPCLLRHVGCLYSRGTCTNGMGTNAPKGAAECDDKYIRHRRPECGERVAGCEHNGNNTPLWEQHRDCRTSFWRGWHNERKAGRSSRQLDGTCRTTG